MYIRTKDGAIYDLKSKEISSIEQKDCWVNIFYYDREKGQYLECDDNGGRSMDTIYKTEILKQADTIEELCDGFYIEESEEDTFIKEYSYEVDEFDNFKQYYLYAKKHWLYPPQNAYGFIKTPKGLIYVAKMDNEGKLGLI